MKNRCIRIASLLLLSALSPLAQAWHAPGHHTIGAIADRMLEGTYAGKMVRQTLGDLSLEQVSVWADCVKTVTSADGVNFSFKPNSQRPECAPFASPAEQARMIAYVKANWTQCGTAHGNEWCHSQYHYSDVSPLREQYDVRYAGAKPYDVVQAVRVMIGVLQGQSAPAPFQIADKREALMLLSHFVGDLHQPLHVESIYLDADGKPVDPDKQGFDPKTSSEGGNNTLIKDQRLHAFWDAVPSAYEVSGSAFADTLSRARLVAKSPGNPLDWSTQWASEVVQSAKAAYSPLRFGPRTEDKYGNPNWQIVAGFDDAYKTRAERYKQAELALAGARLAQALQAVWPEPTVAKTSSPRGKIPLRLIAFNDFHGNLEPAELNLSWSDPLESQAPRQRVPVGGLPALSGLVKSLRKDSPNSLLLSSGDLFGASPLISTLFRHESTITLMNELGVDVDIVGNHEFDAGLEELKRLEKGGCATNPPGAVTQSCAMQQFPGMRFPLLGANVLKAGSKKPIFAPYAIRRVGGVPVGFIGVVTRETPSIVIPTSVQGLVFAEEAETINRTAKLLQKRGVHAIVAMIHEGGEIGTADQPADWNDTSCPQARGAVFDIVKKIGPTVDLILTAHTHQGYRCLIDGRMVMQATSYGRGLSVVDLQLDRKSGRIDRAHLISANLPVLNERSNRLQRLQMARLLPPAYSAAVLDNQSDSQVAKEIAAYAAQVAGTTQRPIGRIAGPFVRSSPTRTDSTAGRLIADAMLAATRDPAKGGAELAMMNEGGVRSDLLCAAPPCTVNFGQVFSMQPFGNDLVVLKLSGSKLLALLEQQQTPNLVSPRFLQPSQGFSYVWHADAAYGQRVSDVRLNGQPIEPNRDYRVVTNNFLASGGDGFTIFREGRQPQTIGQDLDALLSYMLPSLKDDSQILRPEPQARATRSP